MTDKITKIRPPNQLKEKVGGGGLAGYIIQNAEDAMLHNARNFLPVIERHIKKIADITKDKNKTSSAMIKDLSNSITQLKAQGSMFNYPLITEISELLLNLFPRVKTVDSNILDIISAYQVTVKVMTTRKLLGNQTSEGKSLVIALEKACERYRRRCF